MPRVKALREHDVVRVARLRSADRHFDGTEGVCRPPAVGDVGTVCQTSVPAHPDAPITVEMVDADGLTVWLSDFAPDELELIRRP